MSYSERTISECYICGGKDGAHMVNCRSYGYTNDRVNQLPPTLSDKVRDVGKSLASEVAKIEGMADEFGSIRATLILNCEPGRELNKLGLSYDQSKSVHANLVHILEQLVFKNKGGLS